MNLTLSRLPVAVSFFLTIFSITVSSVSAQEKTSAPDDNKPVMMTVTVWNRAGDYVKGLNRASFELTDEKVVRTIDHFENADTPVSVGILIDNSGSMQDWRGTAGAQSIGEAFAHFLELANPNNEYFLLSFSKAPEFLADWSTSQALRNLKANIDDGKGKNSTALYDSCFAAIEKFQTANHSRRVLMLVTDGQDNTSKHTFAELRNLLRGSDVVLYAIGSTHPSDIGSSLGMEAQGILDELTDVTGGKAFYVKDKKQMKAAVGLIATELQHQYRIGFLPDRTSPPRKWRRLKIKVTAPPNAPRDFGKLSVRTRQGYYSQ